VVAADFIDKFQDKEFLNRYFLLFCAIVWLTVGLIFPMGLSMSIIIFIPVLAMMMIGAIPLKKIGFFIAISLICISLLGTAAYITKDSDNIVTKALEKFRIDTWIDRVKNYIDFDITEKWKAQETNAEKLEFINSTKYSQVILASSAIYDGKLGTAPGNSVWRNQLQEVSKDFVFALIVEEYGWIGAIGTIILYMWLLWRAGKLIRQTDTVFSAVVIAGTAIVICFQAFVHIGTNVGLIPVTGQTLPILSRGGTSILVMSAFFGLMLGMSRRAKQNELSNKLSEDEMQAVEDIPIYTEQQGEDEFYIKH
jgi:cell division protein FtsW